MASRSILLFLLAPVSLTGCATGAKSEAYQDMQQAKTAYESCRTQNSGAASQCQTQHITYDADLEHYKAVCDAAAAKPKPLVPLNPEYYTSAAVIESGGTLQPSAPGNYDKPKPLIPLNPEYYTSVAVLESGETLPAGIPDTSSKPKPLVPLNPEYYTSAAVLASGGTLSDGEASPCAPLLNEASK